MGVCISYGSCTSPGVHFAARPAVVGGEIEYSPSKGDDSVACNGIRGRFTDVNRRTHQPQLILLMFMRSHRPTDLQNQRMVVIGVGTGLIGIICNSPHIVLIL